MTTSPAQEQNDNWQKSWLEISASTHEHHVEMHVSNATNDSQMLTNEFNNLALTSQCHTHPKHGLKKLNVAHSGNGQLILAAIFDASNDASNFKMNLDRMVQRFPKQMGIKTSSRIGKTPKGNTLR